MDNKEPAGKAKAQPVTTPPPDAKASAGALPSTKRHPPATPLRPSPTVVKASADRGRRAGSRFHWWHGIIVVAAVVAITAIGLGWKLLKVSGTVFDNGADTSVFGQLGKLILPGDRELKQDAKHRTNILLVGYGGVGHEGPYLADTIILASLDNTTKEVGMLSIPRDFLVDLPGYGYRKINNALAFGMTEENPKGGDVLITKAVEEVTGQTVHYFARVDFNGFKQAVDAVNGVDITVDTAFKDFEYPTYNYGYQTIAFEIGKQRMDGERALQFTRSRHGTNGEGSDFARSVRQQKLLFALQEKARSVGTLTNPGKISGLIDTLGAHVSTTFELWEVMRFANLAKEFSPDRVATRVLETTADSVVRAGTGIEGAYIIQPRLGLGNYAEIQELTNNIFQYNAVATEAAPIQVVNATTETGLADTVGHALRGYSYDVRSVTSPNKVSYDTSIIVDLSNGQAPQTVASLQQRFGGSITTSLPADLLLAPGRTIVNQPGRAGSSSAGNANGNTNSPIVEPKVLLILGRSAITIANSMYPNVIRNLPPARST
ncbi:MAG: LCP family protein [bacterium]|nr:LCP family protein [bacterium]